MQANFEDMVEIDSQSGFCFGVTRAIQRAEEELQNGNLYCLGDIVHNGEEVSRLSEMGLITIDHEQMSRLHNVKVLLRAHGEPPTTYALAERNGIRLFDASCPVVLGLQKRIRTAYQQNPDAQIVIFGKEGHAEVVGLVGQTDGHAIVVEQPDQLDRIDFHKDIFLFSQTTKSTDEFRQLVSNIEERNRQSEPVRFEHFDTICRNVANRVENLRAFASEHDIVVFVGGRKSSNAKVLFSHCQEANPGTLFVSLVEELTDEWFSRLRQMVNKPLAECRIGICGATSTPQWLMEKVAKRIEDEC